jgi:hypothetical protein
MGARKIVKSRRRDPKSDPAGFRAIAHEQAQVHALTSTVVGKIPACETCSTGEEDHLGWLHASTTNRP